MIVLEQVGPNVSIQTDSTSVEEPLTLNGTDLILVSSTGPLVIAYVAVGTSPVVATPSDLTASLGKSAVYRIDPTATHVAARTSGTAGMITITPVTVRRR